MLGERSQTKKVAYCITPSLEHSRKGKAQKHRGGVEYKGAACGDLGADGIFVS